MYSKAAIFKIILFSLLTLTATRAFSSTVVGSIPAEFNVSGGNASYSIPIQVAPGRGGMQPDLSLNYTGGGNGVLGMGWSLGGLSSIHRCPANLEQDGFIAGITFTDKDRYCLDGQRLIPVSGTNGAIGTEYRTEIDGYAQIKSYGGSVNNPSYFIAKTKAGQVITFGGGSGNNNNASLIFPKGTSAWSVREINDSTGNNPITYKYFMDENIQYLYQIDYLGGFIELEYQDRTDIRRIFYFGVSTIQNKKIKSIHTFQNQQFLKSYKLIYSSAGNNNYSIITAIDVCERFGNCLSKAEFGWSHYDDIHDFKEINQWLSSDSGAFPNNFVIGLNDYGVYSDLLDMNGDGLPDRVGHKNYTTGVAGLHVALNKGNGFGAYEVWLPKNTGVHNQNYVTGKNTDGVFSDLLDMNGDGLPDRVGHYNYNTGVHGLHVALNTGSGFSDFELWLPNGVGTHRYDYVKGSNTSGVYSDLLDMNGDGLPDRVGHYNYNTGVHGLHVALNTGSGFSGFELWLPNGVGAHDDDYVTGSNAQGIYSALLDMNGDGLPDRVGHKNYKTGIAGLHVALNTGGGFGDFELWLPKNAGVHIHNYVIGKNTDGVFSDLLDMNGDGLPDRVGHYNYNTGVHGLHVALNTGSGFSDFELWLPNGVGTHRYDYVKGSNTSGVYSDLQDMNNDGLPDRVGHYNYNTGVHGLHVALNTGSGFSDFELWLPNGVGAHDDDFITGSKSDGNVGTYSTLIDINGDGFLDRVGAKNYKTGVVGLNVHLNNGEPYVLKTIVNGLGNITSIHYKKLTDLNIYNVNNEGIYPVLDIVSSRSIVSSVTTSNGIGGTSTVNYHYEGLKAHVRGRGSYGYAKITETYPETGKTQETVFNQTGFPLTGNVDRVVEKLNGQIINESDTTYSVTSANGVYQVNVDQSVDKSYELNGDLITTVATAYSNIDAYGNIGQVSVTTTGNGESFTKITDSTYTNDLSNWYLGRLTETTATHQAPGQVDQQRRSQFGYDSTTGLLNSQSIVSMATGLPLSTTSYQYDAYGHKTQVTVSATGEIDRTTTTVYNNEGKPTQTCNTFNQCETYTYTPEGWVASTTGPNGITTLWEYDGFGRKTKETRADGTETTIEHHFASPVSGSPQCGTLAAYAYTCSISQTTGSQPQITQFDHLGRNVRSIATGFDGRLIYSDTQYNGLAQVTRVSRNYFAGDQIYWANSQYDLLGRVTQMDEPAPHGTRNIIATSYSGLTTTVTSGPEQRQKTTVTNAIGQVIHRAEEEGSYIDYTYTADGNLKTTTVAGDSSTTITLSYDEFGRKIAMDDPDMGQWSYTYNAFGQLISQTDAKNQTTTMAYDILGRMVSRTEAEGTSTWVYGDHTAPQGSIGKLLSETNAGITKTYFYDSLGRPDEATTDITGEQSFSTQTLYDSIGRVSRTIYPGNDNFYTENLYNTHGFLEKVRGLRSNSEQYDLSALTPLVSDAIDLADDYHAKALALQSIGAVYQSKIAQYQALIDAGTTSGSLDSSTQSTLSQHQTALNTQVTTAQNDAAAFYGHLNNTLVELQTVTVLINQQVQTYQDTIEQLTVLAEQTLAAADNSFQYERTLSHGAAAYTELVNDTQYTNYWRAIDVDASGRISAEVYGNGITNDYTYNQATGQLQQLHSSLLSFDPIRHLEYQYDAYQNVTSREDHANDIRETFEYDRLDRLTRTDIVSATYISTEFNGSQTQSYDALGNITHKSDVGHYTYGAGIAGPHAVTQVAGSKNTSYTYDSNGNMTSGDGRQITWSSFNKPTLITKGASSATFAYGPDRARYKKTNHAAHKTLYVGQLYEQVTKGNNVEEKHYIYANGQLVAEHIVSTAHGVQTRYLHKDALGSVDLVTDAYANVVDRRSFDAWGKLRNLMWKDNEGINNVLYLTQLPFTNKGFTGHENIQEVGLIHMNGRVYDATLARFLSSDPHIQSGALTQSYNRYSYVMNNPLKYTDPSGYFFKKLFRAVKKFVKKVVKVVKKVVKKILANKVLGTIAAIAAAFYGGPALANFLGFTGKVAVGAAGGFLGGFVGSGGDLKAALIGGITGAAAGYIGGSSTFGKEGLTTARRVIAHGVVGGVSSVARGGKFGAGFISSAFTKVVSNPIEGFAKGFGAAKEVVGAFGAAIVGGTASALGGGKFSNGAQTAAIQYLFNQVGDQEDKKSLNPFKIISKELPKWWRSDATADLRNGISAMLDIASIPYKAVSVMLDVDQVKNVASDLYQGDYQEAAGGAASLVVGKSTVGYMKQHNLGNDTVQSVAGMTAGKTTDAIINRDDPNDSR